MGLLINGDCIEELAKLENESIDFSCFSPPYDKLRTYAGEGEWSLDLPALGKQIYRVSKDGAVCAVLMQDSTIKGAKTLTTFTTAVNWVQQAGWRLWECLIYQRTGVYPQVTRFRIDHEFLLLFLKGKKPNHFDKQHLAVPCTAPGRVGHGYTRKATGERKYRAAVPVHAEKCRGTIWNVGTTAQEGNRLKTQHPATMPDRLASDLIRCFTVPGDTVLDPLAGSGTTLVQAEKLGRKWIGIEISSVYCNLANTRMEIEGYGEPMSAKTTGNPENMGLFADYQGNIEEGEK